MPKLLAISFASVNVPHRRAFDLLGRRYGWEVHLCAPRSIAGAGKSLKACDVAPPDAAYRLYPLDLLAGSSARLTWFRSLIRLTRRVRPDVVFLEYDPGSLVVFEAFLATLTSRSKIVAYTVENIPDQRFPRAAVALLHGRVMACVRDGLVGTLQAMGRLTADGIACLNSDGQHIYRDLWQWPQPTELIPLGADLEMFRPRDPAVLRNELGLNRAFVIGYFGRLIPEKRVHLLIEALGQLPPGARLLLDMFGGFAPDAYAASLLQRAEELGVRKQVVTIDVPHGKIAEYMCCCDAIALPSTETNKFKEQFGRVLTEAMACGVPVVATDAGYLPTIVGDAGIIIPRDSPRALVEALGSLMSDKGLRARLRLRGLERARTRWSVDEQVRLMDGFFRSVLRM